MTFGLELWKNTVVGHEVNFLVDSRALGLDVGRLLAFLAAFERGLHHVVVFFEAENLSPEGHARRALGLAQLFDG